jgi:polysaccharide deacetylase family protein (PEP-CTERM system associated)
VNTAVLSMDIEDWHHLDYFRDKPCDKSVSLLDGVSVYADLLAEEGIASSFFVLGELIAEHRNLLRRLEGQGHDVGVHGWEHTRPLMMTPEGFDRDIRRCKIELENVLGHAVEGYRASCFSLDRARLDLVRNAGFTYDSSRIQFGAHPLYGTLDMEGYQELAANIYRMGDFYEFQVSTLRLAGRDLPVSGGGYLRIFPWWIMGRLIRRYLKTGALYVLYIHPFELSPYGNPPFPTGVRRRVRMRFSHGRTSVAKKLKTLIQLLKQQGYRFTTFSSLRRELASAGT